MLSEIVTCLISLRLANSQDTLPKLEKWYGKFGVLTKIDANKARGKASRYLLRCYCS